MGNELIVALGERSYRIDRPWGVLPNWMRLDTVSTVAVDSQDRVYVLHRVGPPVVVFEPSGAYAGSWRSGDIADGHGIYVAAGDVVWVADRDAHQIRAFDTDGNLLQTIGERNSPRFQEPFNHVTDVAVAQNGDIYACDGYGNSTVHRFAPDGTLKQTWGRPGTGPGEFTTPHAIWVDPSDRVLVVDRENGRVQFFDLDGEYHEAWGAFYNPMDIYVDADGMIYVTDQIPRLSQLAPDGTLVGRCRPALYLPHGVYGDSRGNLYLAEATPSDRVTKLTLIE